MGVLQRQVARCWLHCPQRLSIYPCTVEQLGQRSDIPWRKEPSGLPLTRRLAVAGGVGGQRRPSLGKGIIEDAWLFVAERRHQHCVVLSDQGEEFWPIRHRIEQAQPLAPQSLRRLGYHAAQRAFTDYCKRYARVGAF